MKALLLSWQFAGRLVGLVMGSNLTAPVDETMERYWYLRWQV